MASPVITTDASGCRVAVAHGKNGFLISVKSVDRLVKEWEPLPMIFLSSIK